VVPNLGVQRAHARLLLQGTGQHFVHRLDLLIEGLGQLVELRQQSLLLLVGRNTAITACSGVHA
jgi:hypothetical protein